MIGASALRYVELNPVRARIVGQAEDHAWSSARSHLGLAPTRFSSEAGPLDWPLGRPRKPSTAQSFLPVKSA